MGVVLVFDIASERTTPPLGGLTKKQFALLVFLGLRRTDTSDGWVYTHEIVERVPYWIGQKPSTAGSEIGRLVDGKSWFDRAVDAAVKNRGPYRMRDEPAFRPDRDAANIFLSNAFMSRKVERRRQGARGKRRRFTPTELQAYDMLVQRGVYLTPVVDLLFQRLSNVSGIADPEERLMALRILATLEKNRKRLADAYRYAQQGLKLARRLHRSEDIVYLLDQLGGIAYIDGDEKVARAYFEEEIAFLKDHGGPRADFHLAGAYRGLASVLHRVGDVEAARAALDKSMNAARKSGNDEAARIAAVLQLRFAGKAADVSPDLDQIPTEHLVARVMALNERAFAALEHGERAEGERLLHLSLGEASRLGFGNEVAKARTTAAHFGVLLDENTADER